MSTEGLRKPALERMHRVLSGHVERKEVPGLVALLSRGDEVHVETLGSLFLGQAAPMRRDSIFRIASISKPVTAAAAMILVDECLLRLDDPVDPWLPELANRRVLKSIAAELDDTVPARRAITVRDLLTLRMGFGSVMAAPGTYPIQRAVRELRLGGDGFMLPDQAPGADEWLRRLGSLPLMAQPGERWMYHTGIDALGCLVARVAGKSLAAFMRERLFEPLGMKDTAFQVPADKLGRLPGLYFPSPQNGGLEFFDDPANSAWHAPTCESGGGGLVATVDDCHAFYRMLLNRGRHGREQILSRAAGELMTSDQVTPAQREGAELFFEGHSSWGFGMAVDTARHEMFHSPGRFGWTGGSGTTAYADPAQGVIGILLTQRMMNSSLPPRVFTDFWTTAYGALV